MMESMIDDGLQYVKSMTPKTLKLLHEEGITTMRRLSMCSVDDVSSIEGVSDNKARAIIYEARERLGMCEFVAVRDLDEKWEWFTTGSENVDDLMDGGITTGRITELFGGFKSGKTNTVGTICITVQLPKEERGLDVPKESVRPTLAWPACGKTFSIDSRAPVTCRMPSEVDA